MGQKFFSTVCLLLALLFTVAAIRGLIGNDFGMVLILPAVCAVSLVIIGLKNFNKT